MKELIRKQREFFDSNQTKDIDFRIVQLKKFKNLLKDTTKKLNTAIFDDFRKSAFDTITCEISMIQAEIDLAIKKVKTWSKRKRVKTDLLNFPGKSYIIPEPLGVSLIIGAWNYPYFISLAPVVAALAAGNTVVLKPSELPASTSRVMAEIINNSFDPSYFTVVQGGIAETEALLSERFDKIFFTGSTTVGRIVYQAAAKHLTPVTLEMGGKNPAFILDSTSIKIYVKRLIWAKFLNAGQTCIAPDYVLIPRQLKKQFIEAAIKEIKCQHFSIENHNYVQIITEKHIERLSRLLEKEKIVFGGSYNQQSRIFEPTIMDNVTFDDPVMQEEIFGPILPLITFDSLDSVIKEIKSRQKPLACYIFTSNRELKDKILDEISFGGGAVNDALMHIANLNMPFGGVGESGIGSYHGEFGFKTFSHYKSIFEKSLLFESDLKYYPRTDFKLKLIKMMFK
ncbi:MAG: aldehyde dehydrogenase family protein [Chitinispirillaceae bacterium]|nr:aldehyde dehydrogenase family protein [Chitinispirillaceae bacterium]